MQKNQILFIVGLVFAIIITLFALTNSNVVVINLLFYRLKASQALIIFCSAALGAIIVTSLGLTKQFKLQNEIKKLKSENNNLTKKIEDLTNVDNDAIFEASHEESKKTSTEDINKPV